MGKMWRLLGLGVIVAIGCGTPAAPSGPEADATAPDVDVSIPENESGAPESDAAASTGVDESTLTSVSIKVPGMT